MLQDPATGEPLGRAPAKSRASIIDRAGRVRPAPKAVAGFDLTFSVPKSVSVAWALADDVTRHRIHAAHQRAVEFVIGYAEREVIETRVGAGGCVSDPVRGVVAAGFDHWDSRAGDPQLHTHVVVLNRVQSAIDGRWRSLDSKALYRSAVALSELYNGVLADELTAELGWGWVPQARRRSAEPKWEVDGVGSDLREEFSQRTTALEAAKDDLVDRFTASHGRAPTTVEVLRLRQEATLSTRPDKHVKPLRELIDAWRARASRFVGDRPEQWVADLANHAVAPRLVTDLEPARLDAVAADALAKVAAKRSTFTPANVLAEVLRELHGVRFAAPADRARAAEHATARALHGAVMLTPPEVGIVPAGYTRRDGTSRFRGRHSEVYSTQALLDAEARLLAAAEDLDAPVVPAGPTRLATDCDLGASSPVGRAGRCRRGGDRFRSTSRCPRRGGRDGQVDDHGRGPRRVGGPPRCRVGHRAGAIRRGGGSVGRRGRGAHGEHREVDHRARKIRNGAPRSAVRGRPAPRAPLTSRRVACG